MSATLAPSRRLFLRGTATIAASTLAGAVLSRAGLSQTQPPASAGSPAGANTAYERLAQQLVGPIFSNPCPFKQDLDLDDDGLRRAVHRALAHGVRIFACTAGNTQYSVLTLEEVRRVNRVMIEAVGGKGFAIAATGDWETRDAIEFARYAQTVGADALQVLRPKHAGDDDAVLRHFQAVASATRLPIVLHGKFSDGLMQKLLQIDAVRAMKEDSLLEDLIRQQVLFGDRLRMFGGGAENRFLVGRPYGMRAYYSTYSTFAPDICIQFWNAILAGDEALAVRITLKYDYPFIRRFTHPFWHATLEHFGLSTRYVRPPLVPFTDEQMKELKSFYDQQGLDPARYRS